MAFFGRTFYLFRLFHAEAVHAQPCHSGLKSEKSAILWGLFALMPKNQHFWNLFRELSIVYIEKKSKNKMLIIAFDEVIMVQP